MLWELLFMMVVLKLPIVYACCVIWWAVRADPDRFELAPLVPADREPCPWRPPRRGPRPRGGRTRTARARARA